MNKFLSLGLYLALIIGANIVAPLHADDAIKSPNTPAALTYTRLYEDADGVSHFGESTLPLSIENYSPPTDPMAIHVFEDSQSATFVYLPPGTNEDWHPVPRRQYAIVVRGMVEVTVRDGESRQFGPGDILLLEDINGGGHQTRVVGDSSNLTLMLAVGDE